jgi:hypothetical protein
MMTAAQAGATRYRRRGVGVGAGWPGACPPDGANRVDGPFGVGVATGAGVRGSRAGVTPTAGCAGCGVCVGPNSGGISPGANGAGDPDGRGEAGAPSVTGLR